MLWALGDPIRHVYYIESGIARTFVEHENGSRKILHFHSDGTVFPGCQNSVFKIEASIGTEALSEVQALAFTREDFYQMYQENMALNARVLETYAMYINLFIYESAHQDYNSAFIKVCNLLYLFSLHSPADTPERIDLTQQDIADGSKLQTIQNWSPTVPVKPFVPDPAVRYHSKGKRVSST